MSYEGKLRKGHNFERIEHTFDAKNLQNLRIKEIFNEKWIILKNLGRRGEAFCYYVCDKQCHEFGTLHLEIAVDGMNSVANQVEFAHKQYSIGNSHRFTTITDCGLINNHIFFMVTEERAGPSLEALRSAAPQNLSPATVAFVAMDLISLVEILVSTGYVLRNFDANQFKMHSRSRQFFLENLTDIGVISDKRYCPINQLHFASADRIDLHWNSDDLLYAPISFIIDGNFHRMTELDMMETMSYVIYELAYAKLPWKNSRNAQKTIEMKKEFLNLLPGIDAKWETPEGGWLHTALQNMLEYMKEARVEQKHLEKLPVRDGAWCPNGARAGALISAVKYREIMDDFHKVVTGGRPAWSFPWREIKLDWEKSIDHTAESREILKNLEMREEAWEIYRENDRLKGKRAHYSIMKEHAEAELEHNEVAVTKYVEGIVDPEDVTGMKKKPVRRNPVRCARKSKNAVRETKEEVEENEDVAVAEVEEIVIKEEDIKEEEPEHTSSSSSLSARAARLLRRRERFLLNEAKKVLKAKKKKKDGQEEEKGEIETGDVDAPIKIEEPDSLDEMELVDGVGEGEAVKEEEVEIKIEEPDDF